MFQEELQDKTIEELREMHSKCDRIIASLRLDQGVIHEVLTQKEHEAERARAAGRIQNIGRGN